jgi:hypothetical protein
MADDVGVCVVVVVVVVVVARLAGNGRSWWWEGKSGCHGAAQSLGRGDRGYQVEVR